ncbi:hypothetical protein GCM10009716_01690 [Streptomyces sodiiphilus]|uniref:CHAD domain-containing protein n=1 Tax=Streptomyces sodiiphilus TaxID=226217 RepID=A0ABN2NQG8_9ACTN
MVRRSQSSNPRPLVVLTAGTDWGTRAAKQRRASGAEFPMPRKQGAKVAALRKTIRLVGTAIKAERWREARYQLSHARALVNALPAAQTTQEREQLARLRQRFAARDTPAAKAARRSKKTKSTSSARSGSKKSAAKSTAKKRSTAKAMQKPKPVPVRDLGDRYINRAALGYGTAEET